MPSSLSRCGFAGRLAFVALTLLFAARPAQAEDAEAAAPAWHETDEQIARDRARVQAASPEIFAPIQDVAGLPRVLLIGDSISIGYTLPVRTRLQGVANIHRAFENCGTTARGVQEIERWLADGPWDVVHFNFGLHDIAHAGGPGPRIPAAQYEGNLRVLVKRMQASGARLVFATTTPVPSPVEGPERSDADVAAYNAIARRVMEETGVAIDDLYAFVTPRAAQIQLPRNVHFTPVGYQALAEPVAASIVSALKRK
jgi:acyl-CoA thioesterase-1